MNGRAYRVLRAAAAAAFPEGAAGPGFQQAQVVERFLEWHADLPVGSRRLVTLLFWSVEALSWLRTGRSFLWLSEAGQLAFLRGLRRARAYPIRLVGDSMKGLLTMIHLSSPAVMKHVGVYAVDEHPADPYHLPVRADALRVLHDREVA